MILTDADELRAALRVALEERDEARAERDAYKKAKEENDERFMRERDEARAARDHFKEQLRERAEALLDARAEVERLRAVAMRLSHREDSLPHDLRDAWDELEKLRARGEELLDEGLVFFYGHERMADVAKRQREACAAYMDRERWYTSRAALSAPLVTEGEP